MIKGLYTSAMGMLMQEAELNVTTNNLANVNTKGYKRDRLTVEEFPHLLEKRLHDTKLDPGQKFYLPPVIGGLGSGVIMDRVTTDHEGGTKVETENMTDFAISGKAYFMVQTPRGLRFTRDGQFEVNAKNELVTKQGYQVLGFRGNGFRHQAMVRKDDQGEIVALPGTRPVTVTDPTHFKVNLNGEIMGADFNIAKVVFKNTNSMEKDGNNVFKVLKDAELKEIALYDTDSPMHQGFLEESNVNMVREMVHMIRIQRAYEANSKILTGIDDVSGQAVRQLGTLR